MRMTTIADSLVAIIVAHYGDFAGGATPAEIYNVLDYKTTPPFPQHTEQIAVWRPEPTERDPVNDNYVEVVHTVNVRISTNTSDDRLKEIVDEVRLIINARGNGVTGVTHQFVSEEDDQSVREDFHFIFELTARLEYDLIPAEAGYDGWDFSPATPHTHDHVDITNQTTDDHHDETHVHSHASTTGKTSDDHHNEAHDHDGDTLIPHALNLDESTTVVRILDQDNMAADADDALVTQQSTKAYVDDSIDALSGTIDADSILIPARKGSAGTIPVGSPVYVSGWNAGLGVLEVEQADSDDASKMPAIGLAHDALTNAATGFVITDGVLEALNTNDWTVGDELYIDTTAGSLTNTRPVASGVEVQKVAQVIRKHISLGTLVIFGAGRSNDIPNDIAASAINSGTLADARIAESSVTQHEAAISHDNIAGVSANDHHTPTIAGDLNHNDLANIDAGDINHLTDAQVAALHATYTDAEVEAIIIAELVNGQSIDNAIDALILTHKNIATAHQDAPALIGIHAAVANVHHVKYLDAEVDAIVLTHKNLAAAHHAKYLDAEAVTAMGAKGVGNPLHHDRYTDGEVEAVITVELTNGQSIDIRIDELIAAHAAIEAAHGMELDDLTDVGSLTGPQLEDSLMFGSGNSAFVPCILELEDQVGKISMAWHTAFQNVDGTNFTVMFRCPLPTVKGSLKLYVGDVRVGIQDADAGDYLDNVIVGGIVYNTVTTINSDTTNRTAANTYTYDFAPADASSYDSVALRLQVIATNAGDFNLTSVELECYYAP